jgi:hypothetical protein
MPRIGATCFEAMSREILGERYWEYILGGSCWEGAAGREPFAEVTGIEILGDLWKAILGKSHLEESCLGEDARRKLP